MYTCAYCEKLSCRNLGHPDMPKNCPMQNEPFFQGLMAEYQKEENHDFFVASTAIEAAGYCRWPRLRETAEFCLKMGYKKIGMGFCYGLRKEARVIADVLRRFDLQVVSVICKTGGIEKEDAGVPKENKLYPDRFESMCNPIAQAKLLNEQKTEFNIAVGLCVGHDSLFYRYSDALVTTLISKDRALGHNPIAAVYCSEGYMKARLTPDGE